MLATVLEAITMFYVNLIVSSALSAGVGIFLWAMSLAKDVTSNFYSINEIIQSKRVRSNLSKQLIGTVCYHSLGKRLIIEVTEEITKILFLVEFLFFLGLFKMRQI